MSLSLSEVVQVVLVLLEAKMEAFGIISSKLIPLVSGTKAMEKTKPKAAMMEYVQNVP